MSPCVSLSRIGSGSRKPASIRRLHRRRHLHSRIPPYRRDVHCALAQLARAHTSSRLCRRWLAASISAERLGPLLGGNRLEFLSGHSALWSAQFLTEPSTQRGKPGPYRRLPHDHIYSNCERVSRCFPCLRWPATRTSRLDAQTVIDQTGPSPWTVSLATPSHCNREGVAWSEVAATVHRRLRRVLRASQKAGPTPSFSDSRAAARSLPCSALTGRSRASWACVLSLAPSRQPLPGKHDHRIKSVRRVSNCGRSPRAEHQHHGCADAQIYMADPDAALQ